jgi:enoyl-CoA hydratase/carnithine racemase
MGALLLSRDGPCAVLEISNPGRANALDTPMLAQLEQHLQTLEADISIRLLLLPGTAGGTFCAGADVGAWSALTPQAFGTDWIARGNVLFERLARLPCLTVSMVEGLCYGGGLELALCTDMRIATTHATFCFPEVGIGAFPGWLGGPRLAAVVGRGRAMEMVLLGQPVPAPEAWGFGLVNRVVNPDALELCVQQLQTRITQLSPSAMRAAKAAFFATDLLAYHQHAGTQLRAGAESAEGIRAFFEKRTPQFE